MKTMKIQKIWMAATVTSLVLALAACGGGGGGGGGSSPVGPSTVVSGVASKGPFLRDSTVQVFSVSGGHKGALLTTTHTTDDLGSYQANLGSYTGPVIVEVSGSYRDEATGHEVPVAAGTPIRAALPMAQGVVTLPVTALTELAVQKAATLSPEAIGAANTLVSEIFKVDVIGTVPVAPTSAALASATQAQKDYTLALAAVSQMASGSAGGTDSDKLKGALDALSQGITAAGMTSGASSAFQTALGGFCTNPNNQTGISDTTSTSLVNAGTLSRTYTLNLTGTGVKGISFQVALPQGASLNLKQSDNTLLEGSMVVMPGGPSDLRIAGHVADGILWVAMISGKGVSGGPLATLTLNLASGITAPAQLELTHVQIIDAAGHPVSGGALSLQ